MVSPLKRLAILRLSDNMKNAFLSLFSLFLIIKLEGQELHFSQYFNSPLLVNPANTGFNPDYDYRLGAAYRNQWAGIIANPYKTTSGWGDAQLNSKKIYNGWGGIGGTILKDEAGSANLKTIKGYFSFAYHQMLGYSSLLSLGVNAGIVDKSFDKGKLVFDNQWNGKFFDVNAPVLGNENLLSNHVNYLDLQAGINYAWFVSDIAYMNVGFSIMHINRPSERFFAPSFLSDQRVPPRYTYFFNGNFKVGQLWILNPNLYISKSIAANEIILGVNANRNLSDEGEKQLIFGLYYRDRDALIPMLGYQLNDVKFTINYDITVSTLAGFNGKKGGYEASIVKSAIYKKGHQGIKCPRVKF